MGGGANGETGLPHTRRRCAAQGVKEVRSVAAGEKIRELKRELERLGYYDFQIREIVFEAVGRKVAGEEELAPEEAERVIDRLSEQISFAYKCLRAGLE